MAAARFFLTFNPELESYSAVDHITSGSDAQAPVATTKMPLQNVWQIWEQLESDSQKDYSNNTKSISSFSTVQPRMVREQPDGTSQMVDAIMIFRDSIQPMWEDPLNSNGGHFEIRYSQTCDKDEKARLDEHWNNIVLGMVGATIEPVGMITGVRLVDKLHTTAGRGGSMIRLEVWFTETLGIPGKSKLCFKILDRRCVFKMRTTMKGGVWKNSEDEILKAAVMKYGMNNWSRVASLLVRKSAKQCKSRWYEWLDPSVKKTEWTREEEEKLLHLAKLFPNQWRTIAPVVGRTAHQCLEHYDKLLDQAQGKTEDELANDPRKLRPGEIDPHPETKPSRADAVDMEDDEKEMLAEARARLANTRGKKAKRKAREKQLEEARRLASLQKRRELKAAGLGVPKRKKKDDVIDYATEIPFEQKVPKGFYALPAEETPASVTGFGNVLLQQLEGEQRINEEKRLRREDTRKLKRMMDDSLPDAMKLIEKINDPLSFRKRTKLTLPEPQLTDAELHEIVDMSSSRVPQIPKGDSHSSQLLQSQPRTLPLASITPMRTPARENTVMLEAQNALARIEASTPLEGAENPVLHEFSLATGATPIHSVPMTPNTLASGIKSAVGALGESTPFSSAATPLREDISVVEMKDQVTVIREQVKTALDTLPSPQNEIELELPDDISYDLVENEVLEEDREEEDKKKEKEIQRIKDNEMKKRSHVIQRALPRPLSTTDLKFNSSHYELIKGKNSDILCVSEQILFETMKAMIINDSIRFPLSVKGVQVPRQEIDIFYEDNIVELAAAAAILHVEQQKFQSRKKSKPEYDKDDCDDDDSDDEESDVDLYITDEIWNDVNEYYIQQENNEYVVASKASIDTKIGGLQKQFSTTRDLVAREAQKAKKLEIKLATLTKGYFQKATSLIKSIENAWSETLTLEADVKSYSQLALAEQIAIQNRKQQLKDLIDAEEIRHAKLQTHYGILLSKKEELRKLLIPINSTA